MLNVVVLIGRMVADPELKYTPNGIAVCSFRIAVDRRIKSASGEKQTDFIDIVAWRQSAEFVANYAGKGRLVSVNGSMQIRSWVQQDGQKRSKAEVVADNIQLLDRQKDNQGGSASSQPDNYSPAEAPGGDFDAGMDYDPFAEE